MKKRLVSLLLVLALMGTGLCGCSGKQANPEQGGNQEAQESGTPAPTAVTNPELLDIERRMFSDWGAYLDSVEGYFANVSWALDYAEAFLQKPNTDNLLKAETVLSYAQIYAAHYQAPEPSVSEEEIDRLIRAGVDADAFLPQLAQADAEHLMHDSAWERLADGLYERVFFRDLRDCFARWMTNKREELDCNYRFLAVMTAYLLLQCGDTDDVAAFREEIPNRWPHVASQMPDRSASVDELIEETGAVLDRMDELVLEQDGIVGEVNVAYTTLSDTLDDLEGYEALLAKVEDDQPILALPQWISLGEPTYTFGVDDANGEVTTLDELAYNVPRPTFVKIQASGVSEEDFTSSLPVPTYYGWIQVQQETEDGVTEVYYGRADADVIMLLAWQNGEARLVISGELPCLAPDWYAYTLLS